MTVNQLRKSMTQFEFQQWKAFTAYQNRRIRDARKQATEEAKRGG